MTFPEHLLELRSAQGLSQPALAKALDISLRAYQNYERGYRDPPLRTLVALADFYSLSLDDLVCRDFQG